MLTADTERLDPYAALIDFRELGETRRNVRYGFAIGGFNLALEPSITSEVLRAPTLYPLPNGPRLLLGLVNLRGNLVPVFDLHAWLAQEAPARDAYLLVIDEQETAAGVFIDGLPTALDMDAAEQAAAPDGVPGVLRPHCRAAYHYQARCWHAVDHVSMFDHLADRTDS